MGSSSSESFIQAEPSSIKINQQAAHVSFDTSAAFFVAENIASQATYHQDVEHALKQRKGHRMAFCGEVMRRVWVRLVYCKISSSTVRFLVLWFRTVGHGRVHIDIVYTNQ